jgi:hypothetical protein
MVWTSLAVLLVIAAVVVLIGLAVAGMFRKERATDEALHDPGTPTVTWVVPPGVDPVVVGAELRAAGYPAALEEHGGAPSLCISCPPGQRSTVRAVIEEVEREQYAPALNLPPVRFREDDAA